SWVRMDGSVRGVSGLQESGLWKWGDLAGKREEMNILPPEVVLSHICIFNSCDVS
nr:hypothetical protein [Tanacetum cinerariifolium]